jgi:hypothetical protein
MAPSNPQVSFHGPLHGLDAAPIQKLLERLTFQASRLKRRQTAGRPTPRINGWRLCAAFFVLVQSTLEHAAKPI